jgi:nucleotide-binding universal stress UspA family protein
LEKSLPRNEIIVGLDDSPSGKAALRWAAQHAVLAGVALRAIHVRDWPYGSTSAASGADISPQSLDEIETAYQGSSDCSVVSTPSWWAGSCRFR